MVEEISYEVREAVFGYLMEDGLSEVIRLIDIVLDLAFSILQQVDGQLQMVIFTSHEQNIL